MAMIINDILKQVNFIHKTVTREIKEGSYTEDYFVEQADCNFMDIDQVREFLTTTKVENHVVLRDIVHRCIEIIDLWNTTLNQLPIKKLDSFTFEKMQKSREDGFELSSDNFHAIILMDNKILNVNGIGKATFREDNEYSKHFSFQDIANKCNLIANWIIAAYPNTDPAIKPSKTTFNHKLTDNQIKQLTALANEVCLFENQITPETLKGIFECKVKQLVKIRNIQLLAYFLNELSPKLINDNWQSVVEKNKLFVGPKGANTTAKNLSASLANIDSQSTEAVKINREIQLLIST